MTDYTKFDAALLGAIRRVPASFAALMNTRTLQAIADEIVSTSLSDKPMDIDRIFDRRLQALRRAGKIRYTGKVWEVRHD